MKLFLLLIGMILVLEGLPYAAAPEAMREWLTKLGQLPPGQLRLVGFIAMAIGLVLCFLVQKTALIP